MNGDNARNLIVNVRDKLDLTLVDGREGNGPFESASDFLQVAFSIGQEPWHAQKVGDTDAQATRPTPADLACIVNVANLSPATITQYEKLVKDGMGLMIFAGEQVDPTLYNDRLYKNGNGLLPARIDRILDGPVKGLVIETYGDSPLAPWPSSPRPRLSKIATKRLLDLDTAGKPIDGVRVLARWNDPEAHPAIIEKQFGKGRARPAVHHHRRSRVDRLAGRSHVCAGGAKRRARDRPARHRRRQHVTAGHEMIVPHSMASRNSIPG